MKALKDLVGYILSRLGVVRGELRVVKLCFLVDYYYKKNKDKSLTGVQYINHVYGAYSFDVVYALLELVKEGKIDAVYDCLEVHYVYVCCVEYNGDLLKDVVVNKVLDKYEKLSEAELVDVVKEKVEVDIGEKIKL